MIATTEFQEQKTWLINRTKIFGNTKYWGERKNYENPDNDSNNGRGITVYGAWPDNGGATTDAGADEGHRDYCADEGEEDAPRAGAEPASGKA